MVLLIIIPIKWLFHWEYTLFSDKPTRVYHQWSGSEASDATLVGPHPILTNFSKNPAGRLQEIAKAAHSTIFLICNTNLDKHWILQMKMCGSCTLFHDMLSVYLLSVYLCLPSYKSHLARPWDSSKMRSACQVAWHSEPASLGIHQWATATCNKGIAEIGPGSWGKFLDPAKM